MRCHGEGGAESAIAGSARSAGVEHLIRGQRLCPLQKNQREAASPKDTGELASANALPQPSNPVYLLHYGARSRGDAVAAAVLPAGPRAGDPLPN